MGSKTTLWGIGVVALAVIVGIIVWAVNGDKTKNWQSFTSTAGKYSLKYPKTWAFKDCGNAEIIMGGNQQSLGTCDKAGQMGVLAASGDQRSTAGLISSYFNNFSNKSVTVNGVSGNKETGTVKTVPANSTLLVGDQVTDYAFYTNNMTYIAIYVQRSSSPNVLADFDTMVSKTLTFNK